MLAAATLSIPVKSPTSHYVFTPMPALLWASFREIGADTLVVVQCPNKLRIMASFVCQGFQSLRLQETAFRFPLGVRRVSRRVFISPSSARVIHPAARMEFFTSSILNFVLRMGGSVFHTGDTRLRIRIGFPFLVKDFLAFQFPIKTSQIASDFI